MKTFLRIVGYLSLASIILGALGAVGLVGAYFYLEPQLPATASLKDVRLQVPLRVYDRNGALLAEFGEMKRTPVRYDQVPELGIEAFLAAEDDRFFEHPGVDYQGILRAAINLVLTGERSQGGSTITMQLARNFFLSNEKTYLRKLNEIFLALKIEQELSKEEILELYLNKIYLGQRSYGVAAAAQTYYGKPLDELNIAQLAMIAGLPKAPSAYNPVADPQRARQRRNYVLRRMNELGFIDDQQYQVARAEPVSARLHTRAVEVEAPYVAEMVRAEMVARFGRDAYNDGYDVYTTLDGRLQEAANTALRGALLEYTRRHGYRGPEAHVELQAEADQDHWRRVLADYGSVGGLLPGLVVDVAERSARVFLATGAGVELDWDEGLKWARAYQDEDHTGPAPEKAADVLQPGDIVRVQRVGEKWLLAEVPEVAGALVSLNPDDGAVLALSGGFDFYLSKFNRVIQAKRQPGSNFKPFIYSAALEKGYTTATLVNDAPVVFEDAKLEASWRPENYSGKFYGPTRLREGLVRSRNLISIRLLQAIGIQYAVQHAARFGFEPDQLSRDLSLALGSASLTPLQVVRGYAVLANGGHRVEPYFIQRIVGADGQVIEEARPRVVCEACEKAAEQPAAEGPAPAIPENLAERTVDVRNVYLVTSMMQDVIKRGTGRRALQLGRHDLAGKTGTTNEQRDAWFSGFNRDVVATAWVGFDNPRPLGRSETGGRAALPMWIDYMRVALDGKPEHPLAQPPGMATVRIDPATGEYAATGQTDAMFEVFRVENVPARKTAVVVAPVPDGHGAEPAAPIDQQLF